MLGVQRATVNATTSTTTTTAAAAAAATTTTTTTTKTYYYYVACISSIPIWRTVETKKKSVTGISVFQIRVIQDSSVSISTKEIEIVVRFSYNLYEKFTRLARD